MTSDARTPRRAYRAGVVANAVAIAVAIVAFPFLVIPTLKLGFVGLLAGGPLALVGAGAFSRSAPPRCRCSASSS